MIDLELLSEIVATNRALAALSEVDKNALCR